MRWPAKAAVKRAYKALIIPLLWGFLLLLSVGTAIGDGIETAGDALQFALPAAGAALVFAHGDFQGGLEFAESVGLTLGVTYALKYTVPETRPNGGGQSFPSAHTSLSFSSAEFMRKRYGWEYGAPAYAAATFVAYSRVENGDHHPNDVIAGAAIGFLSSYLFTKPYKGWHIEVDAEPKHFYGLRLSHSL